MLKIKKTKLIPTKPRKHRKPMEMTPARLQRRADQMNEPGRVFLWSLFEVIGVTNASLCNGGIYGLACNSYRSVSVSRLGRERFRRAGVRSGVRGPLLDSTISVMPSNSRSV
jgi:hypothetical protein